MKQAMVIEERKLNLAHVFDALSGVHPQGDSQAISSVVIDSRQVEPLSLFAAFPGERVDGHDYVADAFGRGAVAALVERPFSSSDFSCQVIDLTQPVDPQRLAGLGMPLCLQVEDSLLALQRLAAYWRARFQPRVVGITGSVGKTTTKELVNAVLRTRYSTLKSKGNLNNEIGLPLTLTELTDEHEYVVLEMGMYAQGEIATLAQIGRPQVGVVTNVGPVHMERLGTMEAIAAAKAELVEALPPAPEGVAILNRDDPLVFRMAERTQAQLFTYGLSHKADLWADNIEGAGLEGIRFDLHYRGETVHIRAPLLGRHSVHTALRAAAVALTEGLGWGEIVSGLQGDSPQLRLVAIGGPNESLLLDDTYNASPASTIAALNLLQDLTPSSGSRAAAGRRVAVLGDMLELGAQADPGHRLVGRRAADVADLLVTVGGLGQLIAEEALAVGMPPAHLVALSDVDEAIKVLPALMERGDLVLIKGSRGVGLNRLVDVLSQRPDGKGGAH